VTVSFLHRAPSAEVSTAAMLFDPMADDLALLRRALSYVATCEELACVASRHSGLVSRMRLLMRQGVSEDTAAAVGTALILSRPSDFSVQPEGLAA